MERHRLHRVDLIDSDEDFVVYYYPRNETAWTNSPYLSIIEKGEDSEGPRLLQMDGDYLINPFTDKFYLDLPFRIDWGVVGLQGLNLPSVSIADLDGEFNKKTSGSGTVFTKWYYSDGIRLDVRTDTVNDEMITPYVSDITEPLTADVREGYVSPGDTIAFEGQIAYVDGLLYDVFICSVWCGNIDVERSTCKGVICGKTIDSRSICSSCTIRYK